MEKEREIFKVSEESLGDYTGKGPWEINGEKYIFVEDYPSHDCDGECHNVIIKRKSDKKFFKFNWSYDDGIYYYEDEFVEVFPVKINKTIYT